MKTFYVNATIVTTMTISKEIKALNLQDATIELLKNSNLNE
jgi:hypothetical protein